MKASRGVLIGIAIMTLFPVDLCWAQCTGYPMTWSRKLGAAEYSWHLTLPDGNVKDSYNNTISESTVRDYIRMAFSSWCYEANRFGTVITVTEESTDPNVPVLTVTFNNSVPECGWGEYPTIELKRTDWRGANGKADLYTTIVHEVGHVFLGGSHWSGGQGVMALADCDPTIRTNLSAAEGCVVLKFYNPIFSIAVFNDFGEGGTGGAVKVDNETTNSGTSFSWREGSGLHSIEAIDYQIALILGENYTCKYLEWRTGENGLIVQDPTKEFQVGVNGDQL